MFSIETLDLQCKLSALLPGSSDLCSCGNSWLILVAAFGLVSFDCGLGPESSPSGSCKHQSASALFFRVFPVFTAKICCRGPERDLRPSSPRWTVHVHGARLHVSLINCLFLYCRFLIDLGQPQNRKWLSINWRSTSFELYFFQDVECLPLLPSPLLLSSFLQRHDIMSVFKALSQIFLSLLLFLLET